MPTTPPETDAPTVAPVVDYEPPARAVTALHRRSPRPARASTRTPASPPPAGSPAALSPLLRAAAVFADAVLRRVLEVIDQRRPAAQLYPLLAAGLVDSVTARHPARTGPTDAATLQRLRVQAVGAGDPPSAVEAFGTYRRGRRVHAVACRIQRTAPVTGPGWQMVALHIG